MNEQDITTTVTASDTHIRQILTITHEGQEITLSDVYIPLHQLTLAMMPLDEPNEYMYLISHPLTSGQTEIPEEQFNQLAARLVP